MRAVLDVNVLISSVLSSQGAPAELLGAWLRGGFELVVSPLLLEELQRALTYPKIRGRLSEADARELLELLVLWATLRDDSRGARILTRDPADAYLLELAREAEAVLVTGDAPLLELAGGMPIRSSRAFLDLLPSLPGGR